MCSSYSILDQLMVDQDDFMNNKLINNDDLKTMLSNAPQINHIKKESSMETSNNPLDDWEFKSVGPNAIWKPNYDWSAETGIWDMLLDEGMDTLTDDQPMENQNMDPPELETPTVESMNLLEYPHSQEGFNVLENLDNIEELFETNSSSESQLSPVSPLSSGYDSASPDKECHSSDDLDSVGSSCGGLSPIGGVTPTYTPESMLNYSFEPETQQKSPTSPPPQLEVSPPVLSQKQPQPDIPQPQTTQLKPQPVQTRQIQFIRQPKASQQPQQIFLSTGRSTSSNTLSSSNITTMTTPTVLKTVTVPSGTLSAANGQTIVVTQGNRTGTLVRSGTTLLKSTASSNNSGQRSLLLPVNQVKTIKIINNNGQNIGSRGLRTVMSTPRISQNATTVRTVVGTRSIDSSKGYLKVTPTTLVSNSNPSLESPKIKEEPELEDEPANSTRELTLTEEEKRLLKKENIRLPSHYPLTKQEERELKRIRRKIRNKISAQDSRKRKKDYIDGLEDRVKQCKEENHELQKRIKTLENQNETLVAQVRRFQSLMTGGGRIHNQASTFLMVFILSTAFLFTNLRSQESTSSEESDLSMPAKMPSTGNSRSLLEAGTGSLGSPLGMDDDKDNIDVDGPSIRALTDHDYAPPSKRFRSMTSCPKYIIPPLDDLPPKIEKNDPGGGDPPDDLGGDIKFSLDLGAETHHWNKNRSDPGGFVMSKTSPSIVVNLRNKGNLLIDDIELE